MEHIDLRDGIWTVPKLRALGPVEIDMVDVKTKQIVPKVIDFDRLIKQCEWSIDTYLKTGRYKVIGKFFTDVIWTLQCPTACTDGIRLFFNPMFANELIMTGGTAAKQAADKAGTKFNPVGFPTFKLFLFVMTHEVYHQLYRHIEQAQHKPETANGKNHDLSNVSMDIEINRDIEIQWPEFAGATVESQGMWEADRYKQEVWTQIFDDKYQKGEQPDTTQPTIPPPVKDSGDGGGNTGDFGGDDEFGNFNAPDDYKEGWDKAIADIKAGLINPNKFKPLPVDPSKFDHNVYHYGSSVSTLAFTGNQDEFNQGYNDCIRTWINSMKNSGGGSNKGPKWDNLENPPMQNNGQGDDNQDGDSNQDSQSSNTNGGKKSNKNGQKDSNSSGNDGNSDSTDGDDGDSEDNSNNGGNNNSNQRDNSSGGDDVQKSNKKGNNQKGGGSRNDGSDEDDGENTQKGGSSGGKQGQEPKDGDNQSGKGNGSSQDGSDEKDGAGEGNDAQSAKQGKNGEDTGSSSSGSGGQGDSSKGKSNGNGLEANKQDKKVQITVSKTWGGSDIISKEDAMKIAEDEGSPYKGDELNKSAVDIAKGRLARQEDEVRSIGKGTSASMDRILDNIASVLKPPVNNWKAILAKHLRAAGDKREWFKMDKRRIPVDRADWAEEEMPMKKVNNNAADVFYLVDISGSVSDRDLYRVFSEIVSSGGIERRKDMKIRKSAFTYFADRVLESLVRTWTINDNAATKMRKITKTDDDRQVGGGTDIEGSVAAVVKMRKFFSTVNPKTVLIVFTDGEDYSNAKIANLSPALKKEIIFCILNSEKRIPDRVEWLVQAGIPVKNIVGINTESL